VLSQKNPVEPGGPQLPDGGGPELPDGGGGPQLPDGGGENCFFPCTLVSPLLCRRSFNSSRSWLLCTCLACEAMVHATSSSARSVTFMVLDDCYKVGCSY